MYMPLSTSITIIESYLGHTLMNPNSINELDAQAIAEQFEEFNDDLQEEYEKEKEYEEEMESLLEEINELKERIEEHLKKDNKVTNIDKLKKIAEEMIPAELMNELYKIYGEYLDNIIKDHEEVLFERYKKAFNKLGLIIK